MRPGARPGKINPLPLHRPKMLPQSKLLPHVLHITALEHACENEFPFKLNTNNPPKHCENKLMGQEKPSGAYEEVTVPYPYLKATVSPFFPQKK